MDFRIRILRSISSQSSIHSLIFHSWIDKISDENNIRTWGFFHALTFSHLLLRHSTWFLLHTHNGRRIFSRKVGHLFFHKMHTFYFFHVVKHSHCRSIVVFPNFLSYFTLYQAWFSPKTSTLIPSILYFLFLARLIQNFWQLKENDPSGLFGTCVVICTCIGRVLGSSTQYNQKIW